jgi:hypothetical protein
MTSTSHTDAPVVPELSLIEPVVVLSPEPSPVVDPSPEVELPDEEPPSLGSPVSEAPSPVLPLVSGVPLLSMLHPEPSPAGEGDTSMSTQHPARVVKRTERAKVVLFIGVARAYPTPHLATQAPQEVAHRSCR